MSLREALSERYDNFTAVCTTVDTALAALAFCGAMVLAYSRAWKVSVTNARRFPQ